MREILTILAIGLIVILTTALAVPYFVNWDSERGLIASQLSNLSGAEVKIRGGIDLKILPTPYLQLADVELADPKTGTDVKVAELHLELALPALMRGDVDFVEARFVSPDVRLRLQNGALPLWRPRHGFAGQMSFDRISVTGGRLVVDDPAAKRAYAFDNIVLTAEADALTGPFRGDGRFETGGVPTMFRFSTGARAGAKLPIKLVVDENTLHPSLNLDGNLIFNPRADEFAIPAVSGTLHLAGGDGYALPWQASGQFAATLRAATLSDLTLQLGANLSASLAGRASFDLGTAPRASVTLQARQLDLDRLLTAKGRPPPLQQLISGFGSLAGAGRLSLLGLPLSLNVSVRTAILGGAALDGVAATVSAAGPQADDLKFAALGPGRAHLTLDGILQRGTAPVFKGHISAGAQDVSRFRAWLDPNLSDAAVPALPLRSVSLEGSANISRVGAVGSGLTLDIDGSKLSGTLAYTKKVGATPARLFADLSAERLELPGLPDLSRLAQDTRDMQLALRLDARAVKLAGSRAGAIETGQIHFDFAKTGGVSTLKNLAISGFDGADVRATGHWDSAAGGELALQLDAKHIGAIAGLVAQLAPSTEVNFIAAHGAEFSPAHIALTLKGEVRASKTVLTAFNASATADGTRILATAKPAAGDAIAISAHIESPAARPLLRQLGFTIYPGKKTGKAVITASAKGTPAHLEARAAASLAGAEVTFDGDVARIDKAPRAAGTLQLKSADISALLQIIGVAPAAVRIALPLDLSAAARIDGAGVTLAALNGTCANDKITGSLSYDGEKGMTGTVQASGLSLGALVQLALGPARAARPGAQWSQAAFAPQLAVPAALIAIHAGHFDLAPRIVAQDADFDLAFGPGRLGLKHFAAKLGGGRVFADLTLRRDGATAAVEGHMSVEDYSLSVPTARAIVSGKIDFAGTGQSPAALIAGLAGSGTLSMHDLLLPRSDPRALPQIVGDVEEDRLSIDQTEIDRALAAAFDRHAMAVDNAAFDVGLAAGKLRLTGKAATPVDGVRGMTQDSQASLDLQTLALTQSSLLTLTTLPRNWTAAPPQAGIEWAGPLARPVRNLDTTSLVNTLAARAIARETARIEAQEFDVHEHAVALNRLQNVRRHAHDRAQAIADVEQAAERALARQATLDRLRQLLASEKAKAAPLSILPASAAPASAAPPPGPSGPLRPVPVPADPSAAGRY